MLNFKVSVNDKETKRPLEGVEVLLISSNNDSLLFKTDSNGQINDTVPLFLFRTVVSKEGYIKANGRELDPHIFLAETIQHEYELARIKTSCSIIPDLTFAENSSSINVTSDSLLDIFYQIMIENPNIIVAIEGHRDLNELDSMEVKRAQAVKLNLTDRGINPKRILIEGSKNLQESETMIKKIGHNRYCLPIIVSADFHE